MKRREFLVHSGVIAVSAWGLRLNPIRAENTRMPYYMLPSTTQLAVPVGDCAVLEKRIQRVELALIHAKKKWGSAGEEYRLRVIRRLVEVRSTLARAERVANDAETRLYIESTVLAIGLLLVGIGIAFTSPLVVGLAVGAQVLLGPVSLAVHSIIRTSNNQPLMAAAILKDRVVLVGSAFGESAGASTSRVFTRSLTAANLGLTAWQIGSIEASRREAVDKARQSRREIAEVEALIAQFGTSAVRWGDLLIKNLEFVLQSLKSYVVDTRDFNCILSSKNEFPQIVPG